MTDTKLLEELITKSGKTKKHLAARIGLTPAGFWNCRHNRAEFKASQINTLCEELGVTDPKQKEAIFFASVGA